MSASPLGPDAQRALSHQLLMLATRSSVEAVEVRSRVPGAATVLTRAEEAECNCPDPCERDHEFD